MPGSRDLVWVALLACTLLLSWIRVGEITSAAADLRLANAELKKQLALARTATEDCLADFHAAKQGKGAAMVAVAESPPPPPGRGNKGASLPPRGGEQLFGMSEQADSPPPSPPSPHTQCRFRWNQGFALCTDPALFPPL
jgi:hypothetical protein